MARPFVVNVREALQHPGTRHQFELSGSLSESGGRVGLPSAWIPDDAEAQVTVAVEAQGGSLIVQGTAAAPWVGECRRCLGPTGGTVEVELHEVFEESPVEGETFMLAGDQVDLAPMLREVLTLTLPLAPLCREDCAGPDPDAHPVLAAEATSDADDGGGEAEPPRDPRWAVLDQLRVDR
jgi:uncharacterized protein